MKPALVTNKFGVHTALTATLSWSGLIDVVIYVSKKKGQSLKSWSYIAGGSHQLYLVSVEDYGKYYRMHFSMKHTPDIYSSYRATLFVLSSITNLKIE